MPVTTSEVLSAERAIVANRFAGNRRAYQAALSRAHASVAVARGILADELRRAKLAQRRRVPNPTAGQVASFYQSYPDMLVREVRAKPAASWLGGKARGFVLEAVAPEGVFASAKKSSRMLQTFAGTYKLRTVGDAQPLGSVPLSLVAPAIRVALTTFAQGDEFDDWTTKVQTAELTRTTCRGDNLPVPSPVELETFVPFLALGATPPA